MIQVVGVSSPFSNEMESSVPFPTFVSSFTHHFLFYDKLPCCSIYPICMDSCLVTSQLALFVGFDEIHWLLCSVHLHISDIRIVYSGWITLLFSRRHCLQLMCHFFQGCTYIANLNYCTHKEGSSYTGPGSLE